MNCMKNIGFTEEEQNTVIDIVVAILLMGNIQFYVISKPGIDETYVSKDCLDLLNQIAGLLSIEPKDLEKAMTTKV